MGNGFPFCQFLLYEMFSREELGSKTKGLLYFVRRNSTTFCLPSLLDERNKTYEI